MTKRQRWRSYDFACRSGFGRVAGFQPRRIYDPCRTGNLRRDGSLKTDTHEVPRSLHYGLRSFGIGQYRSLAAWLMPMALQNNRGVVLVRACINELRRRSVIVPRDCDLNLWFGQNVNSGVAVYFHGTSKRLSALTSMAPKRPGSSSKSKAAWP
jgi:Domain of unknown function (DUF4158)